MSVISNIKSLTIKKSLKTNLINSLTEFNSYRVGKNVNIVKEKTVVKEESVKKKRGKLSFFEKLFFTEYA